MSNDYIPSDGLVRGSYLATICEKRDDEALIGAEFDRWLAAHDAALDGMNQQRALKITELQAVIDGMKAGLDEWETVGAPAWVETKNREIREAKAEAWDEGLSAGCDRWMDAREFGDKPVNPYRRTE